jgi:hypothetical protein
MKAALYATRLAPEGARISLYSVVAPARQIAFCNPLLPRQMGGMVARGGLRAVR